MVTTSLVQLPLNNNSNSNNNKNNKNMNNIYFIYVQNNSGIFERKDCCLSIANFPHASFGQL